MAAVYTVWPQVAFLLHETWGAMLHDEGKIMEHYKEALELGALVVNIESM